MSGNNSNTQPGGLAQIIASVQQITQDFARMASSAQMFNARMRSLSLEVRGPRTRSFEHLPLYRDVPPAIQNTVESLLAKQKASGKALADAATAFAQGMIQWANQLKQRRSQSTPQKVNSDDGRSLIPKLGFKADSGGEMELSTPKINLGDAPNASKIAELNAEEEVIERFPVDVILSIGLEALAAEVLILGTYESLKPGIQAASDASKIEQAKFATEAYNIDHDPAYADQIERGGIHNPGEYLDQNGDLRTTNGKIAVFANGTSALSSEERQAISEGGSVWNLPPTQRGIAIEKALAATEYGEWYYIGATNNGYFDLIDFQKDNMLVSLKTVDTRGTGWMADLRSHIENLAKRTMSVNGQPAVKMLDIRVQPGGIPAVKNLARFGALINISVSVKEYH